MPKFILKRGTLFLVGSNQAEPRSFDQYQHSDQLESNQLLSEMKSRHTLMIESTILFDAVSQIDTMHMLVVDSSLEASALARNQPWSIETRLNMVDGRDGGECRGAPGQQESTTLDS